MTEKVLSLCVQCLETEKNGYGIEILENNKKKEKCAFCGLNSWGWKVKVFGKHDGKERHGNTY